MKILYIGQNGIPAQTTADTDERRVEVLASIMSKQGHGVLVGVAKPYTPSHVYRYGNAQLFHLFSSDTPHNSWLYAFTNVLKAWQIRPDVIHFHGWKIAALSPFIALLCRNSTLVWTVSTLPSHSRFWIQIICIAAHFVDAVSTPYRHIQYELLVSMNIRAMYIPDGYSPSKLTDLPSTRWNLRSGQYSVLLSADPEYDAEWILRGYIASRTKKRLVIITRELTPKLAWIHGRYPQAYVLVLHYGRAFTSLLRQSAGVIVGFDPYNENGEQLLQAMDAGIPLILTSNTAYEEIIGPTGPVVASGDHEALKTALNTVFSPSRHAQFQEKVQKRAQHLFTWDRAMEEYLSLYHYPVIRRIPLDSVVPQQHIESPA